MGQYSDDDLDIIKKLNDSLKRLKNSDYENSKTIEEINLELMDQFFALKKSITGLKTIENEITKAQLKVNESSRKLNKDRRKLYKEIKKSFGLDHIKENKVKGILLEQAKKAKEDIENFRKSPAYQDLKKEILDLSTELFNTDSEIYTAAQNGDKNRVDFLKTQKESIEKQIKIKEQELSALEENDKGVKNAKDRLNKINDYEKRFKTVLEEKKQSYKDLIELQELINKKQREGYTKLDEFQAKAEERTKAFSKGLKEVREGVSLMGKSLMSAIEPWNKANKEAFAYAKNVGMSKKTTEQMLHTTLDWAAKNNVGLLFNKTTDELIKMQTRFSEVLGRNVKLTGTQKKDMMALSNVIGDDNMFKVAEGFDNFGMGMSDSAEFVYNSFKKAMKYGVSASKLTTTIADNIKMAQNYTFKDGLKGLENMAKKAVELKTDMSLVSAMAEKVSTVEGAINVGANLQVLGGSYTLASDPLSLMQEGLMDMEGLFDRVVGMIRGKAYYDKSMGQIDMGAFDKQMIKQMAQVTGVDYNKAMDVAYRQASLDEINSQIGRSSGLKGNKNADLRNMVANMATLKGGRAVVDIDGHDVDVKDITDKHRSKLEQMQKTDSQNMQDMAIHLRSLDELLSGSVKERDNEQANIVKSIGVSVTKVLANLELMNRLMQMAAIGKVVGNATSIIKGGYDTINGSIRTAKGVRNIITMKPPVNAKRHEVPEKYTTYTTKKYSNRGGKLAVITESGKKLYADKAIKYVKEQKAKRRAYLMKGLASTGSRALIGGAGAGAMTLATSMINGSFNQDRGGAMGRVAGSTIGGAIGAAILPFAAPLGTMIGSMAGELVATKIQGGIDKANSELRDSIANSFKESGQTALAELFAGENALQGRYNKRQLESLKNAVSDGRVGKSELNRATIRKLRENGDIERLQMAGLKVDDFMASGGHPGETKNMSSNGGTVTGNSHSQGGVNAILERKEYVVSAKSLSNGDNLSIVKDMNEKGVTFVKDNGNNNMYNSDYSFREKESSPIVKVEKANPNVIEQMQINNPQNISSMNHNFNINLGGEIKIGGIDITNELKNNPSFKRTLANIVAKELNTMEFGNYNKSNILAKFD